MSNKKTNQEWIKEISHEIIKSYHGILSDEQIQATINWWSNITLKALEAKDKEHKEAMKGKIGMGVDEWMAHGKKYGYDKYFYQNKKGI